MSNITQITMGNANYDIVLEDQRNIVQIGNEEPNTVQVILPGVSSSAKTNIAYGEGVPWEIEIEV